MKEICFCLFLFLLIACSFDGSKEKEATNEPSAPISEVVHKVKSRAPDAQTQLMIEKVAASVNKINPEKINYYLNNKRAENALRKSQNESGIIKINSEIIYSTELLNAGKTDQAIEALEGVIDELSTISISKKEQTLIKLKKNLAIAYMRKGEQENCLNNHTSASCIIPIAKEGQHQLREGSEKTIRLLSEILKERPNDKECQYLLNIAHMTLGQYPSKVPKQFRIPEEYFKTQEMVKFKDVAMQLGIDVTNLSGGTCIEDFNGDGYLDIIASSWGFDHQIRYFENNRAGGFIDKTHASGLKGVSGGLNLRHADYNNDGYNDFIILRGAWFFEQGKIPNSLIKNNGDGTFTDVTIEAGIYSEHPTQTAVWSDFNLDGWLDLFIANESKPGQAAPCELFMSDGAGSFKNETATSGLNITGFFKGVAAGDLNNDGYQELYISNLGAPNELFINNCKSGKTQFSPIANRVGVQEPKVSFPTWIFDYNNDGFEDIFVSGYSYGIESASELMLEGLKSIGHKNRPYLYRNNGNGSFSEVSQTMGLTEPITTMGCNFGDLDNDGFLDFYLATGEPNLFSIVPNRMYKNDGGKKFSDVTYEGGFGHIQKGHAVGFGDLDMDGDQDIYAVMGGAFEGDVYQNILFENPIGNKNNWVNILAVGTNSNRSAIGAKICLEVEQAGQLRKIYHTVGTGASFGGNSLLAEIGIGDATIIKRMIIEWPNKNRTPMIFQNVPINTHYKIEEGNSQMAKVELSPAPFAKSNSHHHNH